METNKVYQMPLAKVYPLLVAKAERKGRSESEVRQIVQWLMEKPNKFDPFGQTNSAHLIYHTIAPLKVLVMGVNFILPFLFYLFFLDLNLRILSPYSSMV